MPNAIAEAYAPATAANLGVGFDIIGLALEQPGDTVRATLRDEPGVVIEAIEGDGGLLPLETDKNTAGVAAKHVLVQIDTRYGVSIVIRKDLPLGSGLGSSAASAVAAALAVNALFNEPLSREALLAPSLEGEAVASGHHPDNVGPSLFGGITLFTEPDVRSLVRLPVPSNLYLSLVTPDVVVKTADARDVLPAEVSLKAMIHQTGAVAKLVDALHKADIAALGKAMELDTVIEPARKHLMPYFNEVRHAAHQAGAYGLVISGAGPTLLAVSDDANVAANIAESMAAVYTSNGISATFQSGPVCLDGARILHVE